MHRQIAGKLTGPVTKWFVVAFSLLVAVGMGYFSSQLTSVQENEASSWLPASAESTKVLEELSSTVNPNDIPTLVVYDRSSGLTQADFAAMDEQAEEIGEIDGVTEAGVLSPNAAKALTAQGQPVPQLVSDDGEVAYLYLTFNFGSNGWNDIPPAADEIRDIAQIEGVEVHLAGFGGQAADSAEAFEGIDTNLILITLGVVIVLLLITYRSAYLWILPIFSVIVAYVISTGVVYLLARYADLTVNGQSQSILGILVIGAGTDYALLLVARYREELRRHEDRHEAMAFALHRAAPAIVASAATVAVGMLCLSFAELNSTAGLGPVNAVGIGVTLLVMVTLLPALLVVCGRWVFGPRREGRRTWVKTGAGQVAGGIAAVALGTVLTRVDGGPGVLGGMLTGLGVFSAFIGVLVLLQVAIERWFKVHSRPDFGSREPTNSGIWARVGNAIKPRPRQVWIVTTGLLLLACLGLFKLDASGLSTEDTYTKEFDSIKGQKALEAHDLADNSNTVQVVTDTGEIKTVQAALSDVDGLGRFTEPRPVSDERSYFEAPITEDISSTAAFDIVESSRDAAHGVEGADALVGGGSAFYLDTKLASDRDSKLIIPLVLLVVFLILVGLLRALVAPLLLMGTVVLSFGAALGISALLFEYVFGFAGSDPGFPLFAFVFLVALGIDYNIFLMTRVREETMDHGTREGSLIALRSTGGVITSAGLVLAATFLVLGSIPLVFLAELGVAVALGVLLDTLIVRSVLVTALNLDLGGKIWWPSRLDRSSPSADPDPEPEHERVNA
ncbi:MMPL family transporter [Nocardioides sp.]|uniref:MMPL family transporter n=1 Tax=Nocardioides sp. TaxID=35761 RepID=UPI002D810729|nr:MMPL family transporter [Nocardioides sp.]HET8961584.1 MMPL family transporter [Nocardioides sp.]